MMHHFDSIYGLKSYIEQLEASGQGNQPLNCYHVTHHTFIIANPLFSGQQQQIIQSSFSNDSVPRAQKKHHSEGRPRKYQRTYTSPYVAKNLDEEGSNLTGDTEEEGSLFVRKLEAVLKKPFDVDELNDMISLVRRRKPVVKLRQTRRRDITFPTEEKGLSYLDHYPDFAQVLSRTNKPERQLVLLRSFFFWIQHSCMPDSFKPWVRWSKVKNADKDCYEILPASGEIGMEVVLQLE